MAYIGFWKGLISFFSRQLDTRDWDGNGFAIWACDIHHFLLEVWIIVKGDEAQRLTTFDITFKCWNSNEFAGGCITLSFNVHVDLQISAIKAHGQEGA